MNEVEFIKAMQKAGYTYKQFGEMVQMVKKLAYATFFSNAEGERWPEDPEAFLEDMNEQYESDDAVASALQNVDGHEGEVMLLSDAFAADLTIDDFFEKWEEMTGNAYDLILDSLKKKEITLEEIKEAGNASL